MNRAKVTLSLIFLAGLMTLPLSGCQRQQEGERCDLENADDDCDRGDDLVCTDSAKLRDATIDKVSRCCPEDLKDYGDARCAPKQGGTGDGDSSNGGAGGASGSGGSGSGGNGSGGNGSGGSDISDKECNFNSDCAENLICGPTGYCQIECKQDRDCVGGKSCDMSNNTCK